MSSFRRRNSDWQAYGQWRRRAAVWFARPNPHTQWGRLQEAIAEIKRIHGDKAIMTGAEYEQKISDGRMAD
ncbi:hypothetical protein [Neisseria musculi]|uniref:hypothetical protein n=1 Tax=Neisseria musculi TaxID=1815583 RepID=UPI00164B7D8F|nr:hypothetical protein [Neisseria musculi]